MSARTEIEVEGVGTMRQSSYQPSDGDVHIRRTGSCYAPQGLILMGIGMFNFWNRNWWWLALPILLSAVMFAYVSPALDYEFFCRGGDSCFRAWVSALSGWGAVAAAVATIVFIQRQIGGENRRHREMLALELHPKLALAKRARIDAGRAKMAAEEVQARLEQIKDRPFGYEMIIVGEIAPALRVLTEILMGSVFDDFESEIGSFMPFALDEGRQNLKFINDRLDIKFDPKRLEQTGGIDIRIAISTAARITWYCNDCTHSAERFEAQWKALIA